MRVQLRLYAFANVGRHVGAAEVKGNLARLRRALANGRRLLRVRRQLDAESVLALAEIDEADTPDEHALVKRVYRRWDWFGWATRVPVGVRGVANATGKVIRGAPGVEHWSPARVITEVTILEPDGSVTVVLGGQYPAGAYHGDRPDAARVELQGAWDTMFDRHYDLVGQHLASGHDVVCLLDCNRSQMPKLASNQVVVVKHGVDRVIAIPAPGRVAVVGRRHVVNGTIDSHDALLAEIGFRDE